MKNTMASNGLAEELIRSIVQMGSAEMHLKTLYEKTMAELDNGIIDVTDEEVLQKHIEKATMYQEDIGNVAQMRRRLMAKLFDMFDGEQEVWCMIKHLGIANMQIFESWQASDDDPELLALAIESDALFNKYISMFLGIEVTDCASCLADALKAKE